MAVTLKEGRPLVCVACMLMTFLSLVLQIFFEKFKNKVKPSFKIGHEDVIFDVHRSTCERAT